MWYKENANTNKTVPTLNAVVRMFLLFPSCLVLLTLTCFFFFLSDRTCVIRCIDVLSYLHSVVHGRDSVYTAFTDGVGAHPDVLLQLVQVGELGRAAVHLEAGRFGMSRDPLTRQRFKFDSGKTIIKNPPKKVPLTF